MAYMHMALVGARDGFISAQVSESSPSLKRRGLDSETNAEITHLARKPMPYAFSRTLQVFKHFMIPFMTHFMIHIRRYVYLGIGVIMGNIIKSARMYMVMRGANVS